MKKITFVLLLLTCFNSIFSQDAPLTWDQLKTEMETSNNDILNEKKKIKTKTWLIRAETYLNAAQFNTQFLYEGMPKSGLNGVELLVGQADNIQKADNTEKWIYKTKILFFKDDILEKWEETEYLDKEAYQKAAAAIFEAEKIDPVAKFKNQEYYQIIIQKIRDGLLVMSINQNDKKEFESAYNNICLAIRLGEFPKTEADSLYKAGKMNLYAGMMGLSAKKYDDAEKNLLYCINNNLEEAAPYGTIYKLYKEKGDDANAFKYIKQGFDKHPDDEYIISSLINYFNDKGETEKVLEYIDIAIKNNPSNPSYYAASAGVYSQRAEAAVKKSKQFLEYAHENKKLEFQNRANEALKKKYIDLKLAGIAKSDSADKVAAANFSKSVELYEKSLQVKADFFNANYNLGVIFYNRSEKYDFYAQKAYDISGDVAKDSEYKKLASADLKKSLEYFEKAHKILEKEKNTVLQLQKIHHKLGNIDESKKYKELYEKLKAGQ